jgi:ABC-2 type transport system ATP-binding protein
MAHAVDRPVKALSKGMLQRVGLAAALVHQPELLVLDEPMSGLDPMGRKEVRDLMLEEKAAGRTVFFSTHILSDVETLCDRVCILRQGSVVVSGAIRELLAQEKRRTEITLIGASAQLRDGVRGMTHAVHDVGDALVVETEGDAATREVLSRALAEGAKIERVAPKKETLEDLFVRKVL